MSIEMIFLEANLGVSIKMLNAIDQLIALLGVHLPGKRVEMQNDVCTSMFTLTLFYWQKYGSSLYVCC